MTRFVLEGEWSGYVSRQRQIVHREIIAAKRARAMKVRCIVYTDGTSLLLDVREAKPREAIRVIDGYGSLIRAAERHGGARVHVADLAT